MNSPAGTFRRHFEPFDAAVKGRDSEIASLRREGLPRPLSTAEVERPFALGFALDQLFQNAISRAASRILNGEIA